MDRRSLKEEEELNELNERQEELKKLKELVILQNEDGAVFERDWENASADAKNKYHETEISQICQKNQIGGFGTDPGSDGLFDGSLQKSDGKDRSRYFNQ